MYNSAQELIEALAAAPDTYRALLANVTLSQAQAARGGDENWSVIEVICHLRDSEEYMLGRMRAMRDRDAPPLTGFDQEAWARARNYASAELRDALAGFLATRAQHVAELAALTPEQWAHCGQHDRFGSVSILNHTLHVVWHDAIHLGQIARQLGHG